MYQLRKLTYYLMPILPGALAVMFLSDQFYQELYGSFIHVVGRSHVLLIHISFGFIVANLLSELLFQKFALYQKYRKLVLNTSLIIFTISVSAGIIMALIENYPNPLIETHLLYGLSSYVLFFLYYICTKVGVSSRHLYVLILSCIYCLLNAANLGGVLHFGEGFFLGEEGLVFEFSKFHIVLSHAPILLLTIGLIFKDKLSSVKVKTFSLSLIVLTAISGVLLYQRFPRTSFDQDFHLVVGFLTLFSLIYYVIYPQRKSLTVVGLATLITVSSGTISEFGVDYFLTPLEFSDSDYRAAGILLNDNQKHFDQKIRPILDKKCISCHNSTEKKGKVVFSSLESINGTGFLEKLYVAHNVKESGLYRRISSEVDNKRHMPFLKGKLSQAEISQIKDWIEKGGFSLKDGGRNTASRKSHWSFKRFLKPDPPSVSGEVFNEIDQFLMDKGVVFQPLPKLAKLRKLKITLVGLVPKKKEIKSFHENRRDYESFVDEFLSSRQFGVNLASYWLDMASFADEKGDGGIEILKGSNDYKLFVIKSLNQDVPYDAFLREQLFYRGEYLEEENNYKHMFKYMAHEKDPFVKSGLALNNVMKLSLGLEMKCARCHDHPSEPITNEDYYSTLSSFGGLYPLDNIENYSLRLREGSLKKKFLEIHEGADGSVNSKKLTINDFSSWLTNIESGVGLYTARVFVDHIWRYVFGVGLNQKLSNFGSEAKKPAHFELLNWLTYEFIENDFSVKHIISKMVKSRAFQSQFASCVDDCTDAKWSYVRTMRAENIRDNLLYVTDLLDLSSSKNVIKDDLIRVCLGKSDPCRKRTIFFNRRRTYDYPFSKYLGIPKGLESTFLRSQDINFKSVYFFIGMHYSSQVLMELVKTYIKNFSGFDHELIRDAYLKFYSRYPDNSEVEHWLGFAEGREFKEAIRIFLDVLVSSDEFTYIR